MNVRFGLACLSLLISCWCTALSASAASNGVRPRRQSRTATLNEFLTPPAPPNAHAPRGSEFPRNPHNQQHRGGSQPLHRPQGHPSSSFRHGKILAPSPTEAPGYFARLMGWLNPFGGPTSQWSAQPQQSNSHQQTFNSGHQQSSPPANGYGPPAPAYGPPTNSYEGHVSGEKLPRPPAPKGGQAYLPPAKSRNCNPCNQVPWIPLSHGVKTEDARYAASSTNVVPSKSLEPTLKHQQDNSETNVYHVPSFSQEVKVPDFSYGPPPSLPVPDANNRVSSHSAQLNINNNHDKNRNENFNYAPIENKLPLTFRGPIPNPHLYPGAIPPLFKATPFRAKPKDTATSLDPPKAFADYSQPDTSFSRGGIEDVNLGGVNPGEHSFETSSHLRASLPGSQDYQSSKQPSRNVAFDPSADLRSVQQPHQNIESPSALEAQADPQKSSSHHTEALLGEGYVDEPPPGAETIPFDSNDHVPPTSLNENQAGYTGAADSDNQHSLYPSTDHETQSSTSSVSYDSENTESAGQRDFHGIQTTLRNVQQPTSYGSQLLSDGHHVIHFEQSPIIDLSSIGDDERRKNSNDSSSSSSTSTGTIEDPPVILQNSDGTYGINATWPVDDSAKPLWFEDETNSRAISTTTSPKAFSSGSSQSVPFDEFETFSTVPPSTSSNVRENLPDFTELVQQSQRNDSYRQNERSEDSENDKQTDQRSYEPEQIGKTEGSRQALQGQLVIPEAFRQKGQDLLKLYPGLIKFENAESYGFKLPEPSAGHAGEEPFLKALMKSYNNFKKDVPQSSDPRLPRPGSRESWFDPRQYLSGVGFKPSRDLSRHEHNVEDAKLKSGNRQQGAKKNKQVQIIIPYTSQYTPKPFRPLPEDWSTKTLPIQTQARKVPIYDGSRDYLAQESQNVESEVTRILQPFRNFATMKEATRTQDGPKMNTSIDVLRLQKNIDNWTIQEYSRGTTASTEVPTFSRPYLLPSKKIPNEYLTTTEPVASTKNTIEETEKEISHVLAGFSFNDLEHEASASDQVDVSHVQVSPDLNEVSSVFPKIVETTTLASPVTSTAQQDSWKELPVSISPLNMERVYVVTPQSVTTLPTTRRNKSYDKPVTNETTKVATKETASDHFESIERAYQVLPQAVNNLALASTGPATVPLWGIMEHEKYASNSNDTAQRVPILYAGHSKVSHTKQ